MFKKVHDRLLNMEKYKSAIALYEKGMYRQSISLFREITHSDPSPVRLHSNLAKYYRIQAHYYLGRILFMAGEYRHATREFEEVIALNPEMNEIYEYLATCYYFSGDTPKAMEAVEKRVAVTPSLVDDRVILSSYFGKMELWQQAALALTRIGNANPGFADIHYNLGLAALGNSDLPQALRHFEQALSINAHYRKTRVKLGKTLAYLGDFDSALSQLLQIMDRFPNFPDIFYYLGIIYSDRKEPDLSVESFGKALELNPAYTDARIKLAVLLWGRGRLQEARERLREGISLNPRDLAMSGLLKYIDRLTPVSTAGLFPSETSKIRETEVYKLKMRDLHKTIVTAPDISEMLALVRMVVGRDKILDRKLIETLQQPFKSHARFPDYHFGVGAIFLKAKKYADAEKSFRSALEIKPDYIEAHLMLFNALRFKKDSEGALEAARFLVERDVAFPDFHYALGKVYLSLKKKDLALAAFQKSLDLKPEGNRAEKKRDELIKDNKK